ncbi:class I SAM-dependent methyltransferase [Ignicoccus hospitalis]|uniref:class I SAM-dependent methyltransferase n=1 Tax=Ignicoccus hospitalis TaxID=160233 RepID=UPI001EE1EB35|nr:class I SAM-dependent methyltransferase family protein [Ignicoccus hospitalis]
MAVPKGEAQRVLEELRRKNVVDQNYKIKEVGDKVLIPVKAPVEGYEVVEIELERRERPKSLKECLEERLGKGDWPRSFSVVGDLAVISLKDEELLKYSKELWECIKASQKRVKSLWAKLGTEGEHRVAKLVHLGGEKRTETLYKEYGLIFKVDLAKAYVNPSLSEEHREVSEAVRDGERVLDMFAGVGFFPIHIASKRTATVVAIDLNPNAVKLMIDNIKLNKKKLRGTIIPIMGDASEVTKFFKDKSFDVVIMNLPHKAEEFLNEAKRLAKRAILLYVVGTEEEVERKYPGCKKKGVLDYSPGKRVWRVELVPECWGEA